MEVILGSEILEGTYTQIHSCFRDVINFSINDDLLISIANEKIGGGPLNIVIQECNTEEIKSVTVKSSEIVINNSVSYQCYRKEWILPKLSRIDISKLLKTLEPVFLNNIEQLSLAFLIDEKQKPIFKSTLERAFLEKAIHAFTFLGEDIRKCCRLFKGLGFGLTPSGDDFNAGVLTALGLTTLLRTKNEDFSLKKDIFVSTMGKNPVSNNTIYIAYKGMCSEKLFRLLNAVKENHRIEIELNNFLNIGHTSPIDFLTGLYAYLKRYYDN